MSRVFKSTQVTVDESKFKLPVSTPSEKVPANREGRISEKDAEAIISQKIKEMDELYENTINNAKDEADGIIADAYEKSKGIMEKARQDGFSEGEKEGFEEGKKLADSIIQEALMIKRKIESDKKSLIDDFEKDAVELVISTIEKILNKKIEEEHDTIQGLIHTALEKCAYTENLVLRVSPEDYDFTVASKDKILTLSQNVDDIIIKQDRSLKRGSCIIDSSSGSIDSSIWTQFNEVKTMFEELLRSE